MDKCRHCGLAIEPVGFDGRRMLWTTSDGLETICPVDFLHHPEDSTIPGGLPPSQLFAKIAGLAAAAGRLERESGKARDGVNCFVRRDH